MDGSFPDGRFIPYHAYMNQAGTLFRWRDRALPDGTDETTIADLARTLNVPVTIAKLLVQRGFAEASRALAFLQPKMVDLHDPALMPGMIAAADRLARAVKEKQRIVVYGDYDVDGITGSAILYHMLSLAGAEVECYVPHRIDEGYGLNSDAIRKLVEQDPSRPPLIISVDCGITGVESASVAKSMGIDLIITDHHEFDPANLPDAYALVHPRLPSDKPAYPFDMLCGAGVAFKVAWQFARALNGTEKLPPTYRELLIDLMAFASLGTISDIVPLVGENRVITMFGLQRIKKTRFAGLNALIDASSLRDEKIDSYGVGFKLGPRLNASGRMDHAAKAVELFTTADLARSHELAAFLTAENTKRRAVEKQIFEEARAMVLERGYDNVNSRAIVVGKEEWHQGVIGIVASRLVEAFCRPAVVFRFDPDSGDAHGSARSVDGVSIHEALCECSSFLDRFGGHAMAAGMHMKTDRIDAFRSALVEAVNARLAPEDLASTLTIDIETKLGDLTCELVRQVEKLAPFGRDNPTPKFRVLDVEVARPAVRMGGSGAHLQLTLKQGTAIIRAIGWGMGDHAAKLVPGVRLDMAFEPNINTWQGVSKVELVITDFRVRN